MAAPLTEISIFDLSQRQIRSFPAYRFLYERLIGGAVRPWLASSFGAASVLPLLSPRHRGELIGTLAEDAGGGRGSAYGLAARRAGVLPPLGARKSTRLN